MWQEHYWLFPKSIKPLMMLLLSALEKRVSTKIEHHKLELQVTGMVVQRVARFWAYSVAPLLDLPTFQDEISWDSTNSNIIITALWLRCAKAKWIALLFCTVHPVNGWAAGESTTGQHTSWQSNLAEAERRSILSARRPTTNRVPR